jgi:hypothetical protein
MFRAARALKGTGPQPTLMVHNNDGNFVVSDQDKADAISEWFKG